METIRAKYQRVRPFITDGCLGLISKPAFVSKFIRRHDRNPDFTWADISHVMLVFEKAGRLFVLDANPNGAKPGLLSDRINLSDNCIFIKPLCSAEITKTALSNAILRAENGISYDFINGVKELINRRYKTNFTITDRDEHDICSDLVREPAIIQNTVTEEFKKLRLPFPQDYLRYRNTLTTTILK